MTIKKQKAGQWERGYLSHHYWCGKKKMGVIAIGAAGVWDGVYRWECTQANLRGGESNLAEAKRAVENVVRSGAYQPDLFGHDNLPTNSVKRPGKIASSSISQHKLPRRVSNARAV